MGTNPSLDWCQAQAKWEMSVYPADLERRSVS